MRRAYSTNKTSTMGAKRPKLRFA